MTNTTGFEDYKAVNGVKMPHVMKVSFGPQEVEIKMTEIKVNEGVSDADFQ